MDCRPSLAIGFRYIPKASDCVGFGRLVEGVRTGGGEGHQPAKLSRFSNFKEQRRTPTGSDPVGWSGGVWFRAGTYVHILIIYAGYWIFGKKKVSLSLRAGRHGSIECLEPKHWH